MSSYRTSVIIPAYNAEVYLERTVLSVIGQTDQNFEVVIVDDGSKDRTFAIAQSLAQNDVRIRVLQQQNGGVSSARNLGLISVGKDAEFVSFLDADDIWDPEFLVEQINSIHNTPNSVASHSLARFVDGNDKVIQIGECEALCRPRPTLVGKRIQNLSPSEPTTLSSMIVSGCVVAPSAVVFRRDVVVKEKGFNKEFQICSDWEFYIRVARHGVFAFVDKSLLGYRLHQNNMSANHQKQQKEKQRVISSAISSISNSAEDSDLIIKTFRAAQVYYCLDKFKQSLGAIKRGQFGTAFKQLGYGVKHIIRYVSLRP